MYAISYRRARRIMASLGIRSKLARHFDKMDKLLAKKAAAKMAERDVCMCGGSVDDHNIGSGHSPVEMEAYQRDQNQPEA